MQKFMTAEELTTFDTSYQAVKAPTANNLGQKTFDQLIEAKVTEVLDKRSRYKSRGVF
ncbi:hypothetical protein IID22_03855 [Patescibacteria group bacterium]|nr:hypothetical protein [Patescibacteria group bacterium]